MEMTLDEISKLLGEATQGDWVVEEDEDEGEIRILMGSRIGSPGFYKAIHQILVAEMTYPDEPQYPEALANARLIAAAPTIIKELVERVRKLESLEEVVQKAIKGDTMKRYPYTPRSILKDYPGILEAALNLEDKEST